MNSKDTTKINGKTKKELAEQFSFVASILCQVPLSMQSCLHKKLGLHQLDYFSMTRERSQDAPGFEQNKNRVLFPYSFIEENARQVLKDSVTKEHLASHIDQLRFLLLVSSWTLFPHVLGFREKFDENFGSGWWRDYKTDFLRERFIPWTYWLNFCQFSQSSLKSTYTGAFITLDLSLTGELQLYFQVMDLEGDCSKNAFRFSLTPGKTISEIMEANEEAKEFAELIFPALIMGLSEDLNSIKYTYLPKTNKAIGDFDEEKYLNFQPVTLRPIIENPAVRIKLTAPIAKKTSNTGLN